MIDKKLEVGEKVVFTGEDSSMFGEYLTVGKTYTVLKEHLADDDLLYVSHDGEWDCVGLYMPVESFYLYEEIQYPTTEEIGNLVVTFNPPHTRVVSKHLFGITYEGASECSPNKPFDKWEEFKAAFANLAPVKVNLD